MNALSKFPLRFTPFAYGFGFDCLSMRYCDATLNDNFAFHTDKVLLQELLHPADIYIHFAHKFSTILNKTRKQLGSNNNCLQSFSLCFTVKKFLSFQSISNIWIIFLCIWMQFPLQIVDWRETRPHTLRKICIFDVICRGMANSTVVAAAVQLMQK